MNHHFPRFALILLLLTSSNMVAAQEPETRKPAERPIPPPSITDGMNQFALDLHRHLGSETTDNLFVSPASISTALTMTSAGARGETLAQMTRVLHLPEQQVHEGFAAMIQHLNQLGQQDDLELVITNTLWGQHDYEFLQEVVHKAFVDVNEKGTEAAAATGVVVGVRSARPTPTPESRADHPFFFLIRDTQSGTILFTGRLNNPST